ncbi:MAG: hypothetical protein ACTTG8_06915 [Catonella sp.]|uniref:hypothetical protein n=1 Tax=Catonella sp. TaxID=2382125 RepID=UPI003FA187B2
MEVFGKFWSIIIGFILIFICPIYLIQIRIKSLIDIETINLTDRFLDKVKYTGYIDKMELDNFYVNLSKIGEDKEVRLLHRKRAVRPIFHNGDIIDSREFYIEVSDAEIKSLLKNNSKYKFKIGDEVCCTIHDKGKMLNMFPQKTIELGGMVENEYIQN